MPVIEIVEFKANPAATSADIRDAWTGSQSFITAQRGYLNRWLLQCEDGAWVDQTLWQDMDCAKAAHDAFNPETYPELATLLKVIEAPSLVMRNFEVTEAAKVA